MPAEEPQADNPGQLDLYLEKAPDDNTLERMRQVAASKAEKPFEADIPSAELGQLIDHGELMEGILRTGTHRIRQELEKRGAAKLAEVKGCETYGRVQLLSGRGMKSFHTGANEKEAFYVGMDVRPQGASVYSGNYEGQVERFGRKIEREYPGYLVTWDGRPDHPVNLWVPISKL